MKKIVLASLLATGLMAAGNENYFGISAGEAKSSLKASAGVYSATADDTETAYNFTLGHYYGDKGRVSATYSHIDYGGDIDKSDALSVSYDFMLPVAGGLSLYAGPSIGYVWYEDSVIDLSGMMYGAQGGVNFRVTDAIELDAGYRYMVTRGDADYLGVKVELEDVKAWYVGAIFRF